MTIRAAVVVGVLALALGACGANGGGADVAEADAGGDAGALDTAPEASGPVTLPDGRTCLPPGARLASCAFSVPTPCCSDTIRGSSDEGCSCAP